MQIYRTRLLRYLRNGQNPLIFEGERKPTVSATLTVSPLSFSKLATSVTIALTLSGGNSFADAMLLAGCLLPLLQNEGIEGLIFFLENG